MQLFINRLGITKELVWELEDGVAEIIQNKAEKDTDMKLNVKG
jgi:hypothetical protein